MRTKQYVYIVIFNNSESSRHFYMYTTTLYWPLYKKKIFQQKNGFKELAVPRTYYEKVRSNTYIILKEKMYIRSGKFANRFYSIPKRPNTKKNTKPCFKGMAKERILEQKKFLGFSSKRYNKKPAIVSGGDIKISTTNRASSQFMPLLLERVLRLVRKRKFPRFVGLFDRAQMIATFPFGVEHSFVPSCLVPGLQVFAYRLTF